MEAFVSGRLPAPAPLQGAIGDVHVRFAMASINPSFPLSQLALHHPPIAAGSGTPSTPHVGITSAVGSVRFGERIELLGGTYRPTTLRSVAGVYGGEVTIQPVGYRAAIEQIDSKTPDASTPTRIVTTDPFAAEDSIMNNNTQGTVAAEPTPNVSSRPLTATERQRFARCVLAPMKSAESEGTILSVIDSKNIRICGLELRRGDLGVNGIDCDNVELRHCVVACSVPFKTNTTCLVPATTYDMHATARKLRRMIWAGDLPAWVRFPGYVIAFCFYAFFVIFSLFLTAGFTDETANEWIIRSAVAMAVSALIVQPFTASVVATFTFTNAVLFAVLAELSAFAAL